MRLTSIIRSAEVSKKLVKPKMRGLLIDGITRTILEGFVLGAVVSAGWYFWAMKPRKENYANFYKNYDAEAVRTDAIQTAFPISDYITLCCIMLQGGAATCAEGLVYFFLRVPQAVGL